MITSHEVASISWLRQYIKTSQYQLTTNAKPASPVRLYWFTFRKKYRALIAGDSDTQALQIFEPDFRHCKLGTRKLPLQIHLFFSVPVHTLMSSYNILWGHGTLLDTFPHCKELRQEPIVGLMSLISDLQYAHKGNSCMDNMVMHEWAFSVWYFKAPLCTELRPWFCPYKCIGRYAMDFWFARHDSWHEIYCIFIGTGWTE